MPKQRRNSSATRGVRRRSSNNRRYATSDAGKSKERCPYHPPQVRPANSPMRSKKAAEDDEEEWSPASRGRNISQRILHDPKCFARQSELYQGKHREFLFNAAKCKVGSRADRVYSYYAYDADWRRDRYLKVSQEADHKGL